MTIKVANCYETIDKHLCYVKEVYRTLGTACSLQDTFNFYWKYGVLPTSGAQGKFQPWAPI